jgi:hypothetical protein
LWAAGDELEAEEDEFSIPDTSELEAPVLLATEV